MKKYKRGLTAGVYDMFHIGHLNILKNAKKICNFLIVAVSTDEVVLNNKHKTPIIPFNDRVEILKSIKYVDDVIAQTDYDVQGKIKMAIDNEINVMFVGSDWQGTEKWNTIEEQLNAIGCDVVYLPHTDGISSSELRKNIITTNAMNNIKETKEDL
jgi:glycerol-3-phosphate cytidylyltransferase